jgi:hypothetical protein
MNNAEVARLGVHGKNIDRYRELLKTNLAGNERQFIERRLNEEAAAVELLRRSLRHPDVEQFNA